ncbi:hypothetical protein DFH08DRAFT_704528 [Mycena albidolilacea]|uniref:Uncharacterized protein n=1 Tax=Mycena albidolilacea TaxID=1033008 RepID=A0AAD7ENG3_9AGAR|nr:hypothetical protein DFH08DRAFT_704528 [Mycena albidolilacea]
MRCEHWLSQENHIFDRLRITAEFENYALVDDIEFKIRVSSTVDHSHPTGFLFLCPVKDLQTGPSSFRWPACPAYWSLDSSGGERLSVEDATRLGFPAIRLNVELSPSSWDARTYAGLRKFHCGKGFDPHSQDVARHLGHPIYQVSGELDAECVHISAGEMIENVVVPNGT